MSTSNSIDEFASESGIAEQALHRLREATRGTEYEGCLYLVGGALRDRALGLPHGADLDLVLVGSAVKLAEFLYHRGLSTHYPVLYPRFGTAMIHIACAGGTGVDVELVTARSESYSPDSRKPDVTPGTLREDIYRRDFTINTLAESLHTGELIDITGRAMDDIRAGVIRTPLEPRVTFYDDPLRMLRAVRFAARFRFEIEAETWSSIIQEVRRLSPPQIAFERIRDEFVKIAMLPGVQFRRGMELLQQSGLLQMFLPEMLPMVGCTQGSWHRYDVWEHTLLALEALPADAALETRLGLLWHDIGKPPTRTEDAQGVHFYGHPTSGAELARQIMNRLKFSNEEIRDTVALVKQHMRPGEYRPEWEAPAVRRLIRDTAGILDQLLTVAECDLSATQMPEERKPRLDALRERTSELMSAVTIDSPLDGKEIMQLTNTGPGVHLRDAKELLTNAVIDGKLEQTDKASAERLLMEWWEKRQLS